MTRYENVFAFWLHNNYNINIRKNGVSKWNEALS